MREWIHSEVYRKTIVLMAQRLGGGGCARASGIKRTREQRNGNRSCFRISR